MVTDLHHLLDLPEDTPGPARRLAHQLTAIARAATAGDTGPAWTSALPCPRRPARSTCPGRIIVQVAEPDAPIHWQCSTCQDTGTISNWQNTPHDLRRRRLADADSVHEIIVPDEVAAALRDLQLLDPDSERIVYRARAHPHGAILTASNDDLEELIGFLAAEANHETNRRRQQRLDTAFDTLNHAAATNAGRAR